MSKKLKVLFYLGKLEMNTKQILFYAIRMYCTRIENIISYHKRTMVKSINWLTKNSSERIWHTALILSGGGSLQSALTLILYGHMIKIYCQNNTVFSATFSIEFTQPATKLTSSDVS